MNKKVKRQTNKDSGITVIMLIITIIIIIIISVVVIRAITGENGILNMAISSTSTYKRTENKEYNRILQAQADAYVGTSDLETQNINYTESLNLLKNPDRGFYYPCNIEGTSTGFDYSQVNSAIGQAKADNKTLLHLRIDISKLSGRANGKKDLQLSKVDKEDINKAFDLVRTNKLKAIVRIAYDFDGNANKEPDTLNAILKHIQQFREIFETNKDVITVVETGFIGIWGEMHTSDYSNPNDTGKIIQTLLKNVPDTITVNARTLDMYRNLYGSKPITESIAYDGSDKARLGMFNDGYLGSESDLGTYRNREEDLRFLETHARYTIFGGEAVAPDNQYNDINYAQKEMFRTHTTYLNYVWNTAITQDKWVNSIYNGNNEVYKGKTAQKYIEDHLGYRFVLRKSKMSKEVKQGEKLAISINVENTGFGNVVNEKKVQLILKSNTEAYKVDTNVDVREWDSNKTTTKNIVFTIPGDIVEGEWEVYLKIVDSDNEQYVIEFANDGIWDESLQANYIGMFNVIKNDKAPNVGLKQEYAEFVGETTKESITSEYKIKLDGKITNASEWKDENIIYQSDNENKSKLYAMTDEKYLYLYVEDQYTKAKDSKIAIHIKFATKDSVQKDDYKYSIENSQLYKGNLFVSEYENIGSVKMKEVEGYEYIIPLNDIGVEKYEDLNNIWVRILDASNAAWTEIYNYTATIKKQGEVTIKVDGKGDEWTDSQLVAEKEGIKVYYHEKENYGYLYCTPIDKDIYKYALVKYGTQDECYSIAYSSGHWNGTWEANDVTKDELFPWSGNASLKENVSDSFSEQGENGIEFQMKLNVLDTSKNYTKMKLELFTGGYGGAPNFAIEFERKK